MKKMLLSHLIMLNLVLLWACSVKTVTVDLVPTGETNKGYAIFYCHKGFPPGDYACFPCNIYDLGPEGSGKEVEVGDTGWVQGGPVSLERKFKYSHKLRLALTPGEHYYRVVCYGWGGRTSSGIIIVPIYQDKSEGRSKSEAGAGGKL